jgi:hypothetical protein
MFGYLFVVVFGRTESLLGGFSGDEFGIVALWILPFNELNWNFGNIILLLAVYVFVWSQFFRD